MVLLFYTISEVYTIFGMVSFNMQSKIKLSIANNLQTIY